MQYRSEIDGLRALAILPVLWLHADLPGLSGGYLGVDVFFVISGFLITSIISRELRENRFSVVTFYERRARRILPALAIVLMVTSVLLPFITQSPKVLGSYGESTLAVVGFVSNMYFWQTTGYFGSTSELSPLLHTWSLAVEEQYYVLFPLLAMLLVKHARHYFAHILGAIFVLSLGYAQWLQSVDPTGNFYLLPGRAWELMAGALASLYIHTPHYQRVALAGRNILSGAGLVMILVSYIMFTPATAHPSALTLLPVTGTVLLLLFATTGTAIANMLSLRFMLFIGIISYSLYLWHQPVLALLRIYHDGELTLFTSMTGIVLSFGLSVASWRWVERPFRDKQRFDKTRVFKYSGVSLVSGLLLGLVFYTNVSWRGFIEPHNMARYQQLASAYASHTNQPMVDESCKLWSSTLDPEFARRFEQCSRQHDQAVFILGGSHGMDLYNAVAMNSETPFVVSVSRGSCRAHGYNGNPNDVPQCQYEDFLAFAEQHDQSIGLVIYTQTPDRLFTGASIHEGSAQDINQQYIRDVVAYLTRVRHTVSAPVLMIGMLPPLTKDPVDWNYQHAFSEQLPNYVSHKAVEHSTLLDEIFAQELTKAGIGYISKLEGFGLRLPDDLLIDNTITYSDRRHISTKGEQEFGRRLLQHAYNQGYSLLKPAEI
ncbi:acyltransferase [Salinimonas marina]|uniref:Acyltransferase n=1 Tax=Salinimonas marina TaxID=2785918 RepID=A0A7S9E022_9ALTE|nr:acyltransferase family protein [Salinimonas marina]QPG06992.1 acyltransferase [Salinimonas marina]